MEAIAETLGSKIIAETIAGAFKDGVVQFQGEGSGTSDSNLIRISNNESVITEKGTLAHKEALIAINKGTFDSEYLPKYAMETGLNVPSIGNNMANSVMVHQLAKMNKYLPYLEQIANKPETSVKLDNLGNVIEETNHRGMKTVVKHITSKKNWI